MGWCTLKGNYFQISNPFIEELMIASKSNEDYLVAISQTNSSKDNFFAYAYHHNFTSKMTKISGQ